MLVGREREQARLAALVDEARHGSAGALVLRGEPGVGKSALLDRLVATTDDALSLRAQGFEAEAPLPFAALHRLLRPLTPLRDDLPAPQARALRIALGEEEGPAVEPFLVGVATLSLLTAAAEERLVMCVVDDAHWLDPATRDALLFCARRIDADRVFLLLAARDGAEPELRAEGVPEMVVDGLATEAARTLVEERLGGPSAEVVERLVADTRGNPLGLVELSSELTPAQRQGTAPLPARLHLTTHLEQVFLDRSRRLSVPVQKVLLLVAADDTGQLAVVRDAAAALGADEQAVEAAVGSGLLSTEGEHLDASVKVRHPLVRSALYQGATVEDRRRVHLALADALVGSGDPDRETWHRARAAAGPDPGLAEALAGVGTRAEGRGGYDAALTAFERAAALSGDPSLRARLTLAAARNAWACGQVDRCRGLVSAAAGDSEDPVLVSDLARLRGRMEVNLGSAVDAHRIFVEAAQAVHAVDPARALEMATAAAVMATYGADSGARLDPAVLLAETSTTASPREVCLAQMLTAMTAVSVSDWRGAVAALAPALESGDHLQDLDVLANLGNAALQLGDDVAQQHVYSLTLSRARESGAVMTVIYSLQRLCFGWLVCGDWAAVRRAAQESLFLSGSTGPRALTAPPLATLLLLAALQGRDDYDDLLADLDAVNGSCALGILTDPVHDLTRWAKGVRAAGAGDPTGAVRHFGLMRLPAVARMASVDRIEAAVRADEPDRAVTWVDELDAFAQGTARRWAAATVAYGRAMTTEGPQAAELYEQALTLHAGAGRAVDRARTRLAYGEWLRRAGRRVDARTHLRHALGAFQDVHAAPFEARAAQELRTSGETARTRDPSTLVQLTPMELKVAQLVASGMSNKDVAGQIWVSPRTVAFHLRNVFAKAGITSRGELARLDLG